MLEYAAIVVIVALAAFFVVMRLFFQKSSCACGHACSGGKDGPDGKPLNCA